MPSYQCYSSRGKWRNNKNCEQFREHKRQTQVLIGRNKQEEILAKGYHQDITLHHSPSNNDFMALKKSLFRIFPLLFLITKKHFSSTIEYFSVYYQVSFSATKKSAH